MALTKFNPAPLPNPPREWDSTWARQFIRVLEIYFAQLESATPNFAESYTADFFYGSGIFLTTAYASFESNVTQTVPTLATAGVLAFEIQNFANLVELVGTTQIRVDAAGIYRLTYNMQLQNTTNDVQIVSVWISKNGVDLPSSTRRFGISQRRSSGSASFLIADASYIGRLDLGDILQVVWSVTDLGVSIVNTPAQGATGTNPAIPATPSVFMQMAFVSA